MPLVPALEAWSPGDCWPIDESLSLLMENLEWSLLLSLFLLGEKEKLEVDFCTAGLFRGTT